jgi:signal transduction histidine kinase
MLTFSRSRRGEPRTLALAPLIRESVKLLRSSLPATVALGTDLDDDAPPVLLDPGQLEQVLMNLAINARDAMRSSGEIRVAVRFVERVAAVCTSCRKTFEGDMVELSVSDNGPGIAADVQERMFEPFFTTKDVGQGSGMGLSTVHGIVHEHGGHVVVESVEHSKGFAISAGQDELNAPSLVVATGGLSIPKMGATSFGYDLARQFGVRTNDTRPALVPLLLNAQDLSPRACVITPLHSNAIIVTSSFKARKEPSHVPV